MPNGSDRVTSHPLQELQPTKTIDDPDIKAWLALGTKTKKKGGGKKKKGRLEESVAFNIIPCVVSHFYIIEHSIYISKISLFLVLNGSTNSNACFFFFTGKKGDKVEESAEAEPMDSTNGATSQD